MTNPPMPAQIGLRHVSAHPPDLAVTPASLLTTPVSVSHPHARSRVKRGIDVVGGLALLMLALLLFPLIGLAVRCDSAGGVIYRQTRVGLHGAPFTIYKFRTMRHDAEADGRARWAQVGDSRVTRCGRFLRATRLDELPQAFNVIRGEMSLVGPRPERPELIEELRARHSDFPHRQVIKPGLTGLAQVKHRYTSCADDWQLKLAYDLEYVRRASHWFDLCILLRTVRVVLGMRGT